MNASALSIDSVFGNAIEIGTPEERVAYLDAACAGNESLRAEVDRLLHALEKAGTFMHRRSAVEVTSGKVPTIDQPSRERPGIIIAGRYKLLEQIGEGGMETVWVAEQTEPVKRRVALKLIKPGMDSRQVLSRFEAERQALALMDHPSIAKVYDGGMTDEGRPFFVMEYVKGMPITEYCDHVRLSIADRLKLFVPVCQAVQHAHHKGIIHRDLKPSNILICLYDGQPVPKVIDFGLAKAMHQPLTEHTLYTAHGLMVGTPLYMSPEQAEFNNLDVDTRTDIYSLGVILYELLTGATPLQKLQFKDAAFQEILRLIKEVEPQRPSLKISTSVSLPAIAAQRSLEPGQLSRAVRGDLDWIVMKSLEKERSRRYETATSLARDIERYLKDEPVEACPPSAGYRVQKFARKHRAALATAAAFAGLLVLGAAVSAWLAVRATVAERQARSAQGQAETDRDRAQSSERLASERLEQVTQEKERAEKAERQAAVEAAIANAVNDFLQQDLLGQADLANQPGGVSEEEAPARDANIKVRTLLDRAAERIVGRFPDQPLVEAATRQVIGDAYFGLNEYALAQPHMEAALDIRRQHLGVQHSDTLTSQNKLGHLYMRQEQYAKAEPLYLLTLEGRQKKLGPDHPDTLTSQDNLARLYHLQAQFGKAESLLLQTLDVCQKKLGEDHAVTLASQNHLAMLYARLGRYSEAERLFLRTLEVRKKNLGKDHPHTVASQDNLRRLYSSQGQDAKVELLYRQKKTPGEDDPSKLIMEDIGLAGLYIEQNQYAKAEPLLLQTLDVCQKKLGDDHLSTAATQYLLATLYRSTGYYVKAESLYAQALEAERKNLGEDHVRTLRTQYELASLYRLQGQYAKAEALLLRNLEGYRQKLGEDHRSTLSTETELAVLYTRQGRYAQAEPLFLQTLEARKQKLGEHDSNTLKSQYFLAVLYVRQGRYTKAEALFLQTLEAQRKIGSALGQLRMLRTQNYLAELYRLQGQYPKAEELFLRTLEVERTKLGEDDPETIWCQHYLAVLYRNQGRYSLAEPLLQRTLEVQQKIQGEDNPETLTTQFDLAVLYRSQGQYTQAEPLLLQTWEVQKNKLGEDNPGTLTTQYGLAVLYQSQGLYAQADPLLLDVLERQRRRLGAGHPDVAATLASLGLALLHERKFAEAELRLRDCLTIYQPQQPDAWQTFDAQSLLGASLLGQQKYAEAEPLLVSGYQGLKQRATTTPAENRIRLTEALQRLVDLYTAWDKPDKAAKWRLELDAVKPASQAKDGEPSRALPVSAAG